MTDKEYKETVVQISGNVLRFLNKNLRNAEEAKDILQESLITLWNNRLSVEKPKAKSYLFTVAYRKMLKIVEQIQIRSERIKNISNFNDIKGIDKTTDYDNKQQISHAVEQLPENMRTCLLLKDWEGYKTNEISQIMSISEDNVKITLFRARRMLRKMISYI